MLEIIGINASGILNKIDSFEDWLLAKNPAIFTIQETKVPTLNCIKSDSIKSYQLYEQIRLINPALGGGLCVGVTKDLPSSLLREGGEEAECLSVQVEVGQQELVIVCGYGPQETAGPTRKEKFWNYLEREVQEAVKEEKMILIQIDSNSWLGNNIIPNDPNKESNSNGKIFQNFLKRNKNITLVNSMSICEGVITRQRITEILNEKSSIDVFLVCDRLLPFVKKMFVDEKRESPLTNFNNLNKGKKITETDHNKLELSLQIETPVIKPKREVLFNFKSKIAQETFHKITNNSTTFQNCFKSNKTF